MSVNLPESYFYNKQTYTGLHLELLQMKQYGLRCLSEVSVKLVFGTVHLFTRLLRVDVIRKTGAW